MGAWAALLSLARQNSQVKRKNGKICKLSSKVRTGQVNESENDHL